MAVRRIWAFALAILAAIAFGVGFFTIVAPPEPDCPPGPSVYCKQEAYDRVKFTILGAWGGAILLLGAAITVLLYEHKWRGQTVATKKPQRKVAPVPTHTSDGRRVVSTQRPTESKPKGAPPGSKPKTPERPR